MTASTSGDAVDGARHRRHAYQSGDRARGGRCAAQIWRAAARTTTNKEAADRRTRTMRTTVGTAQARRQHDGRTSAKGCVGRVQSGPQAVLFVTELGLSPWITTNGILICRTWGGVG